MGKDHYDLKIYVDGAIDEFAVDDDTVQKFENWLEDGKGNLEFMDKADRGVVIIRNEKIIGAYKKIKKTFIPDDEK